MRRLCQPWGPPGSRFGDVAVVGFFLVQVLDGTLTYLGLGIWGAGIEANPLIRAAIAAAGPEVALASAKLLAIACGIVLHLQRVHHVVAGLTAFYLAVAVLPWTALLMGR